MQKLQSYITEVCQRLYGDVAAAELQIPEKEFGDYSTNIAMQLAGQLKQKPRDIAEAIKRELSHEDIASVDIAGPGFINISLTDSALLNLLSEKPAQSLAGKRIVVEYSDPNPFKVLHAGHLYTSVVGDAIANLLEGAGGEVHRVNFGGDVGLHVAKTMYIILRRLGGEHPEKLDEVIKEERSEWLAGSYIEGTVAYEEDEAAKAEITKLNKRIYQLHENNDTTSPFAQIYWTTRQWSYDYFDAFYERIGSGFERYYPESEAASKGLEIVKQHIGDVFHESQGAVVFKGEDYGLHTRVFINSEGLPTYETKDIGLLFKKYEDYSFDTSLVITGNEQLQYMGVVLKAVEQFAPELSGATTHLTHGMVKLKGGEKMSSRKGNILRAIDVIDVTAAANKELAGNDDEWITLAAIKYAFLKTRIGSDIMYEPEESVSLQGNSGPYLQYAHARARSILAKIDAVHAPDNQTALTAQERTLVRTLGHFSGVVDNAVSEMAPHIVCTYLFDLAQTFNRFYESNRVVGDERQLIRAYLVKSYAEVLRQGLRLLGMAAPEEM